MSSQPLGHLSMFLATAIIIWACETRCRFSYILRFVGTVLSIIIFYLIFFLFLFSSVLLRAQKWGMDLLGISGFFSQRAHTRHFCGSHPRVTFLATHKLFLFCSQYDDSSAISCCPTVPPAPRPQKRAAQATRESLKAKRSKSAARFLIRTAVNPPRNIPPNWSLFLLPATTKPLPQWTSCHSLRSRARMTPNSRHISSSSEGARWCERDSGCCCTGVSSGRNSGHYR